MRGPIYFHYVGSLYKSRRGVAAYSCQFLMTGGPERAWQLQMILGHADMSQIKNVYARSVNETLALESMRDFSPGDRLVVDRHHR